MSNLTYNVDPGFIFDSTLDTITVSTTDNTADLIGSYDGTSISTFNTPSFDLNELYNTVQDLKELVGAIMIIRDRPLEEEFPRLKKIADEYQRELEKYKTFKTIKGE